MTPPTLIPGWYRHQDSQGKRSHACRTLPGNDTHYVTLCGQVWLRDSIALFKQKYERDFPIDPVPCVRCMYALPRWEAK